MYRRRKPKALHGADILNKLPNGYRVNLGTTEGLKNQSLRGSCERQQFHFMHGDRRGEGRQGMLMQNEISLSLSEHVKQDTEEKISFTKSSRAWRALYCLGPSSSDELMQVFISPCIHEEL